MNDSMDLHFKLVIKSISRGKVIPFFGAGVNRRGLPKGRDWKQGLTKCLPSGDELAAFLAKNYSYPMTKKDKPDLMRVAQYVASMMGTQDLYDELREVFNDDYPPTPLHRFFAHLPSVLRKKNYTPESQQLIVTTNYDDVLERAFQEADEPFDLVTYVADGKHRGKFLHLPPNGRAKIIETPNEYVIEKHPVILKIHGAVDRKTKSRDSYVITEDHYIDYLARTDISSLIPVSIAEQLSESHLLFLGYSLTDWNLRVIFHRIWEEQKLSNTSWAIQLNPNKLEQKFWNKRGVEILDKKLGLYIKKLNAQLKSLPIKSLPIKSLPIKSLPKAGGGK